MKIRNSLKSLKGRHRDNRVIRRRGRTYVINKTNRRFRHGKAEASGSATLIRAKPKPGRQRNALTDDTGLIPVSDQPGSWARSTMNAPGAVVFDIGNVLFDWDPRFLYERLIPPGEALDAFLRDVVTRDWHSSTIKAARLPRPRRN